MRERQTKLCGVYALCDPRTGGPRYVGVSNDIHRRYQQHCLLHKINYRCLNVEYERWKQELHRLALTPTLCVVELCDQRRMWKREQHWIKRLTKQGFELYNEEALWLQKAQRESKY